MWFPATEACVDVVCCPVTFPETCALACVVLSMNLVLCCPGTSACGLSCVVLSMKLVLFRVVSCQRSLCFIKCCPVTEAWIWSCGALFLMSCQFSMRCVVCRPAKKA